MQEFRSSGVQEFRSSGVQEFRSSGVQEFRSRHENPECEEEDVKGEENKTRKHNTGIQWGEQPHPAKASHQPEANIA